MGRTYIAIDLKSFYASVECVERDLDPLDTNLVVADKSRTEKTICLAVSPSLKVYGIPGRARLFEVIGHVKEINYERRRDNHYKKFEGISYKQSELLLNKGLELSYIIARPRMAYYVEYSTRIYNIYLKYIAPEDIHVYSIDEVFIDVTSYLAVYNVTARELTMTLINDVLKETGITATAGIGTNMYLCKIAMDIEAKHIEPDENGVRIAELDEMSYRKKLWEHKPLTDFWRIGDGYAKKLEANGMYTMGDIARCSLGKPLEHNNEDLLYKLFGVNAELLIDHAWGYETATIADIKSYKPQSSSISSGQVLKTPYATNGARLIVKEMIDALVLDLVDKGLITDKIDLTIGYDTTSLNKENVGEEYVGEIKADRYGRKVPKSAHGLAKLKKKTSSSKIICDAVLNVYDEIINKNLLVRRVTVAALQVMRESEYNNINNFEQLDLFNDFGKTYDDLEKEKQFFEKEKKRQKVVIEIKKKYGKNAILKGMNYEKDATGKDRNSQIGGHRA